MKRIDSCKKTDLLVGLLFGGVVAVLLAYRIFAYLCEVTAFQWWMVLLGALSVSLDFSQEVWEECIKQRVPAKFVEANLAAFAAGRAFAQK